MILYTLKCADGHAFEAWFKDSAAYDTLRAAGQRRTAIVDGGVEALRRAGVRRVPARSSKGNFTARAPLRLRASITRVDNALSQRKQTVLVDAREKREYQGARPYGEKRGGHLPGAVHLHYKRLLREDGRLLGHAALRARLRRLGITADKTVISYCSGGVRSAWLTAALRHLGYGRALNYAGSMWQWSAQPAARYPLVKR